MGLSNINESKSLSYSKDNNISYFSEADRFEIQYECICKKLLS